MRHLLEYRELLKPGDLCLIEYWYNDMITPVKIIEKVGRKYKVSHDVPQSEIKNAPDELILPKDIM